jgi:hypothetical protein
MMTITPNSPLAMDALTYLSQQYLQQCTKPLDPNHIVFSADGTTSTLTITSRPYATTGEVGKYLGAFTAPYVKVNVGQLLPHPVDVDVTYPVTWADLRAYLNRVYGLVLGAGEFALSTAPTIALVDSTVLTTPPDLSGDILTLIALPTALLWTSGSRVLLRIPRVGGRLSLNSLIAQSQPGDLARLVDFPQ